MKVGELCARSVPTIRPDELLVDAARLMREWRVAGLVVTDEAQHPIGILTDRDIVLRAVGIGAPHLEVVALVTVDSARHRIRLLPI